MNLTILPCHGIWKGGDSIGENPNEWFLAPFQLQGKDHLCFKQHIINCIEVLNHDSNAIVIISGGATKQEAGPKTEADSYYDLLKHLTNDKSILDRVYIEPLARDSFENVIFLFCRYYEILEKYPEKVTIVGFEFKRNRFLNNHVKAMKFPLENANYIGNEPTPDTDIEAYFEDLNQCEYKFAVKHFETDFYGIKPPLITKKMSRNPFNQVNNYPNTNPQLKPFLLAIKDDTSVSVEEAYSILQSCIPW